MSNNTLSSRNVSRLGSSRRKLYIAMLAATQLMVAGKAFAAPEGGVVVGGTGTIDQAGLETTIHQSTERMAIDWQSFDVKSNERVQFIQPKSTSVALNRVVSNKGSEILGRIDANGQVFLINPNGVVFGKDSQINVGGIIASGLSIDPDDFMNGEFTLTALEGTEGKVINSGIINAATGGSVTLVGQQVKNEGLISANLGAVNLAAGKEAVVTFDKTGLVGIKVTKEVLQKDLGVDAAVINSGEINANGGKILITASVSQDIFSDAVNNGGMNKASSVVVHEDGSFTLGAGSDVVNTGAISTSNETGDAGQIVVLGNNITNSGDIHADAITGTAGNIELHSTDTTSLEKNAQVTAKASTQGVGGDVKVLGNKVGLFDTAEVNASGANGGGQVLVGGDQTGSNIKIRNADFIYVSENTNVKTDGLVNGDGGKLITFASNTARIYGNLSARGGSEGGNGGFIETSGLKGFEITKTPDISASAGQAGVWLIDPDDIEIKKNTNGNNVNLPGKNAASQGNKLFIFSPLAAGNAILDVLLMEDALEAGGTVIVKTSSSGTGAGNIAFNADMAYDLSGKNTNNSNPATLIFDADNNIIINNKITREFDNQNKLNVELKAKGNIEFAAGAKIETQGGTFKASGVNFTTFDSTTAAIFTNGGNVLLDVTGAISIASGINTNGGNFTAELSSNFDNSAANGSINVGVGDVSIATSKFIKLGNITAKDLIINRTNVDPSFNVLQSATTGLNISGNTEFDIHASSDVVANGAGSILLNGSNSFGNISFISAGNVGVRDVGAINLRVSSIFGTFNLVAGGEVTQSGALNVVGTTLLSAAGKNIVLDNPTNNFQSSVSTSTQTAVNSILLVNKNNFSVGDINAAGDITLKVDPAFVQSSIKEISLNGSLTSSVGTITFENQVKNTAATNTIDAKAITFNDNFIAAGAVTFKNADDVKIKGDFNSTLGASLDVINTKNFSVHDVAKTKLTINASGVVSINSIANSGITGSISSNIQGTDGFAVDISGDQVSIGDIDVTGGGGTPVTNSGFTQAPHNAGAVTIAGVNAVSLNGDIKSEGGAGNLASVDGSGQPVGVPASGLSTVTQIKVGTTTSAGTLNLNHTDFFTSLVNLVSHNANGTLNGFDLASLWSIAGANSGNIKKTADTTKSVTFTGFGNLIGGTSNDSFIVGATGSMASIDGGDGGNTLTGRDAAINTWQITGASKGGVTNVTSFSNIQNLQGGTGDDTFDFSANDASVITGFVDGGLGSNKVIGHNLDTTWIIDDLNKGHSSYASFSKIQTLQAGSAIDTFTIDKDFGGTLSGAGGNDIFNINVATTSIFSGGLGNDTFNIKAIASGDISGDGGDDKFVLIGAGSAKTIHGGNGVDENNTLTGSDSIVSTWTINGTNKGVVNGISFDGIQNLQGGSNQDAFVFFDGASIASANGGGGTGKNTADLSNLSTTTAYTLSLGIGGDFNVSNVSTFIGNDSNLLTLRASDADNTWIINGLNSGAINGISFAKFGNILGGTGADTFVFNDSGSISKASGGIGAGVNTVDMSQIAKNTLIALDGTGLNGVTDISRVIGNKNFTFTLNAGNSDNTWTLDGVNKGTVQSSLLGATPVQFVDFNNLVGGAGADTFVFKDGASILNATGGAGINKVDLSSITTDAIVALDGIAINGVTKVTQVVGNANKTFTLSAGNGANTWAINNVNSGSVQNAALGSIDFIDFKNVVGGSGDDSFSFGTNGAINSINGGAGNNLVVGRNQNSNWNITQTQNSITGYVNNFTNIQNLQGGSAVDTFFINQAFAGNIKGGAGADIFKINAASTGVLSGEIDDDRFEFGITGSASSIDGGSAAEKNTLVGRDAVSIWNITAQNAGEVLGISTAKYASFTNIQMLEGSTKADTFNINFAFAGTINAGGGDDIFNVNATAGRLLGDAGNDQFVFNSVANAGSAVEIDGGVGTNTLVGRDGVANTWTIPLAGASTLGITGAGLYVSTFSNIQTLLGGSGDDTFNIEIDFSGSIDAGGGLNTFVINKAVGNLKGGDNDDIFTFGLNGNATSLDGGGGINTLAGRNVNNTWNILAENAGTLGEASGSLYVNTFSNIQKLQGGSADDTFVISHAFLGDIKGGQGNDRFTINENVGKIFGGEGDDTFTFSGASTASLIDGGLGANNKIVGRNIANTWTLSALNDGTVEDTNTKVIYASFLSIQSLQGGSATDTLVGANVNTTWTVVSNNTGSLDDKTKTLQFSNIENLIGNQAADDFVFSTINSSLSGRIEGGTSSALSGVKDTLDVKALTNGVKIELGDANNTNLHVSNIETITASSDATKNFLSGSGVLDSYTWVIDGVNKGSVAPTNSTSIESKTTFENFGHVLGGNKIDQFQIGVNGEIADLDGGDGDDYLDYSNKTIVNIDLGSNGVIGSTQIKSIEGIKGNNDGVTNTAFNSVIAADGGNTWTITGINDGQITLGGKTVSFENFNVIHGGTGNDKFELGAAGQLIGTIHGEGGDDIFNASASTLKQVVAIDGAASGQTNLVNIGQIVGNLLSESALIGANQNNDWTLGNNNAGNVKKSGTTNSEVIFSGFARVIGGANKDTFTISSIDGLKIIIDGGSAAGIDDVVNLTGLTGDVSVGAGEQAKADIKVVNIGNLNANANATANNTLISDDASNNVWSITGKNKGTLNAQLSFDGFANLLGGKNADTFNFNGALANITGVIDGGLGVDNLNVTAAGRDLSVRIVNANKAASAGDVNIINVESVEANAAQNNSLIASDVQNQWTINSKNSGLLSTTDSSLQFTNFSNLIGGLAADNFVFDVLGELAGYIDGGVDTSKDIVDVSKLTHANIVLGNDGVGYRNIENYIGNNADSILTGDKNDNVWTLSADKNSGDVNNKVFFTGFTSLQGGIGNDVFQLLQGELSGSIQGGAGNDTFNVSSGFVSGSLNGEAGKDALNITIATGSAQQTKFLGGADTNTVNVVGGDPNFIASHTSTGDKSGQLSYTSQTNTIFNVLYSDIAVVRDDLIAASLTLNNTFNPDVFAFANNSYSLNNSTQINYANKANLIIAGAADDKVSVDGEINDLQSLTIQNASVLSSATGLIRVSSLNLNNIGNVGDAANRVNINVDTISVNAANGDIYLKEANGLAIDSFSNNKLFVVSLAGDLTSNKLLTSFGDVVINSSGNINLNQDNMLSGNLTLSTGSDINFRNIGVTNLSNIKAQNININSTGSINGNGEINVNGKAVFASGDAVILMNAANDFNELTIASAIDASITDKDLLTLTGVNASGEVDTHSSGVSVKGVVSAGDLILDAGQKSAIIDANVSAVQSLNINALGITTTGKLSASDINLNGLTGDVVLGGALDTSGKQAISVVANNITQNAKIVGGSNVDLHAMGSLIQSADIESVEAIQVVADADLTMNANTTSKGNDIGYTAGGAMNLLGNIVANNSIAINGKKAVNQIGNLISTIGDVVVKAGQFFMNGDATITATKGAVLVNSDDDIVTRNITATGEINLQAADSVQIDKTVSSTNGAIKIAAVNNVVTNEDVNANSGVSITSTAGDFLQHAQINSQQADIIALAKNNIIMDSAAISTATNGHINYSASNIALNVLNAKNGTVLLTANPGAITDNNGSLTNITAKGFDAVAGAGIGADDSIETSVSELSASNSAGNIGITNSQTVNITQLRTNGNITFENLSGNVALGNLPPVAGGETPNRPVTDTTYQTNNLIIKVGSGNLLASGTKSVDHPEITATNTALIVSGTIGLVNRPLVIDGATVTVNSRRTWKPIFASDGTVYTDIAGSSASASDITATSHEQLVQVETLAEVNPAVFTSVRNYVYDDVAILLPEDQRYDDSGE